MRLLLKILFWFSILILCLAVALWWMARKPVPEHINYGMSFNTFYATELGLDWKTTYDAIINDLGVRHLRLAAHWPMIEPEQDVYNFSEMDYQVKEAERVGADIIFALGRRLPRWPECHIPDWAKEKSWDEQKSEIISYITNVVERYRDSPAIVYWQVENEPYLSMFALEHCGELDDNFLREEIALVHELDPSRPVLITDSGNLGTWFGSYKKGDAFGTSVYVYFWNPDLGQFKTILPPWFYRAKEKTMAYLYGVKPTFLIELSAEPWLINPLTEVPLEVQYSRMDLEKFNDILNYAEETRYDKQYLWGAEWWYWLLLQGDSSMWNRGKELFEEEIE